MVSAAVVVSNAPCEGARMTMWCQRAVAWMVVWIVVRIVAWVSACVFMSGLAGCSLWPTESEEVRQRDAVQRLGVDALNQLFVPPKDALLSRDDMVLVARPVIEPVAAQLPIDAQVDGPRLRNALVRAILQLNNMPQVVGWAPRNEESELAAPLWRLNSHFSAFPPITLSDRQLFPYRLSLTLQRPHQAEHTVTLSGAFDSQALGPQVHHDALFSVE